MTKLVLASGSPRRKELLAQLGYTFDVASNDVEERREPAESPFQYVKRLSKDKALAGVAAQDNDSVVIGSDTIVVQDDQVLEKPKDFADAKRMLLGLSGKQHQVMTAVTVANTHTFRSVVVTTDVWFKPLSEKEIEQYWQTGEPCDKAGSYGIQGLGGRFVTRIEGSYYAVVGLPLFETDQLLQEFL
ncbi:septum formation inhibitor Maf [Vibrio sp. SCSIO 43135]|uniref:dTTP/UTP pyrophosphatase n=1 Tax=Vibrio paucivorans TaxID=2829489 RepID=A0A9X3CB78_9VIBR|nr:MULTISPECIES: Maf family protein [Vibrio]MCW8332467.1 Maf-like protein [Vibrio paucivorans]USD41509.1 septum formation inhibitor Maf [Vibrio sp. SCSIO 43135]